MLVSAQQRILKLYRHQKKRLVLFVLVFAVLGSALLLATHAATPTASLEPELGVKIGASSLADSVASGGSYVQFGSGTTPGALAVHVSGNHLVDGSGNNLVLHGINRSGTEYACVQGFGPFDGPSDATSVTAMLTWKVNVVRVPLNEDCWLGINGEPNAGYSAAQYKQAVIDYVSLLHSKGLYAIVELHWNAPGTNPADANHGWQANTGQQAMPDQDHAPAFWTSVATSFKNDPATIFDLYNEPFPGGNQDTTAAWTCWKNGGSCSGISFQVAGMQSLVDTVRATGASNVIMLGGVQFANALGSWLANKPTDSLNQLAASWHSYDANICNTQSCWDSKVAPVAAQVPLMAGEIGTFDGSAGYVNGLMSWLDGKSSSYLGWTWDTWGCGGAVLISNYNGTACSGLGAAFKAHLLTFP